MHSASRVEPWDFVAGPTFMARIAENCGEGVVVRMRNELPADHVGFGCRTPRPTCMAATTPPARMAFRTTLRELDLRPSSKTGEEYDYIYPCEIQDSAVGRPT